MAYSTAISSILKCHSIRILGIAMIVLNLIIVKPSSGFNIGDIFSSLQNQQSSIRKMTIDTDSDLAHKVEDTLSHLLMRGAPRKLVNEIHSNEVKNKIENAIGNEKVNISPFLWKGAPIPIVKSAFVPKNIVGRTIVPTPCMPGEQAINITSIMLKPDTIYFPGTLTFGFDITFNQPIAENAMLTGDLKLYYQSGSATIEIPCLGNIGSCSYQDLCGLMRPIAACPQEFNDNGIPCKCPFNKGRYKLPALSVDVMASVFMAGTYKAQMKLSEANQGELACYNVAFTIGG